MKHRPHRPAASLAVFAIHCIRIHTIGVGIVLATMLGCARNEAGDSNAASVEVIRHTFIPRPETENYWEPVKLERDEKSFILQVHPRLKVPSEGPWTLTIRNSAGKKRCARLDNASTSRPARSLFCAMRPRSPKEIGSSLWSSKRAASLRGRPSRRFVFEWSERAVPISASRTSPDHLGAEPGSSGAVLVRSSSFACCVCCVRSILCLGEEYR